MSYAGGWVAGLSREPAARLSSRKRRALKALSSRVTKNFGSEPCTRRRCLLVYLAKKFDLASDAEIAVFYQLGSPEMVQAYLQIARKSLRGDLDFAQQVLKLEFQHRNARLTGTGVRRRCRDHVWGAQW